MLIDALESMPHEVDQIEVVVEDDVVSLYAYQGDDKFLVMYFPADRVKNVITPTPH
jgi:hypothetical protein